MTREFFAQLWEQIDANAGRENFKSENYLKEVCAGIIAGKRNNLVKAHQKSTGGFISGEVKLFLTLCLLLGGLYMDLALLYETGFAYSYKTIHHVIANWINNDKLVNINGEDHLNDEARVVK